MEWHTWRTCSRVDLCVCVCKLKSQSGLQPTTPTSLLLLSPRPSTPPEWLASRSATAVASWAQCQTHWSAGARRFHPQSRPAPWLTVWRPSTCRAVTHWQVVSRAQGMVRSWWLRRLDSGFGCMSVQHGAKSGFNNRRAYQEHRLLFRAASRSFSSSPAALRCV